MWQERTTNSDRETKKNKNKKKNGFQLNILKSLIRIWFDFNLFVNVRWFGFGDVCRRNFEQKKKDVINSGKTAASISYSN